jgi:hypothetical protein
MRQNTFLPLFVAREPLDIDSVVHQHNCDQVLAIRLVGTKGPFTAPFPKSKLPDALDCLLVGSS